MLGAVAGMGGLFIGLYYAAVSTVASSIYQSVPNDIRGLLARDRLGTSYMRFLAVLTYSEVCLFAFLVAGIAPAILAIPLVVIGAGFTIVGFIRLGARAFNLFDPTALSDRLLGDLRQAFESVQAGRFRWSDPSFQNHARRLAENSIDSITVVAELTEKAEHLSGRPYISLSRRIISFLVEYEAARKTIPTESLWHAETFVHSGWYVAADSNTTLGHNTSTMLQPKPTRNRRWIEASLMKPIFQCLDVNMRSNRYGMLNELLVILSSYVKIIATEHDVGFSFQTIRDIYTCCRKRLMEVATEVVSEDRVDILDVMEHIGMLPISALIGYSQAIEASGTAVVGGAVRRIRWRSRTSMYKQGLSTQVLERIEWLWPRLAFERQVERGIVTPSWYLEEFVMEVAADSHSQAIKALWTDALDTYDEWIDDALAADSPWLAAVLISKAWEYAGKLEYRAESMRRLWNELSSGGKLLGLAWPQLDIKDLERKFAGKREKLVMRMGNGKLLTALIDRPDALPDYAGQFVHIVGESILNAVIKGDSRTLRILIRTYFGGVLLYVDRARSKLAELGTQHTDAYLHRALAPLLEVMDLSGYGLLFAEYHDKPEIADAISCMWDDYLGRCSKRIEFIAGAIALCGSPAWGGYRESMYRWRQSVFDGLAVERVHRGVYGGDRVVHKSALVRVFARSRWAVGEDGVDVFCALYIRNRSDGEDVDFGWNRRDMREEIEREEHEHDMDSD